MSQRIRQSATKIVALYNEILASTGKAPLTDDQREALKAFLVLLYEKSNGEHEESQCLVPPLVG
jgi:hypothetical protein